MKYLVLATLIFVSGCTRNLPECGDPKTIKDLKQIVLESFSVEGIHDRISDLTPDQVIVRGIETLNKEDNPPKNNCRAIIEWKLSPQVLDTISCISSTLQHDSRYKCKSDKNIIGRQIKIGMVLSRSDQQHDFQKYTVNSQTNNKKHYFNRTGNTLIDLIDAHSSHAYGSIQTGIDNVLQKECCNFNITDTVKLSDRMVNYSIRRSEDADDKGQPVVYMESLKDMSLNLFNQEGAKFVFALLSELAQFYRKLGEKYIKENDPLSGNNPVIGAESKLRQIFVNVSSAMEAEHMVRELSGSSNQSRKGNEWKFTKHDLNYNRDLITNDLEIVVQPDSKGYKIWGRPDGCPTCVCLYDSRQGLQGCQNYNWPVTSENKGEFIYIDAIPAGGGIKADGYSYDDSSTPSADDDSSDSDNQTFYKTSFDCSLANKYVEKTICSDPELSQMDLEMVQKYKEHGKRFNLKDAQREWLKLRNQCNDKTCIADKYTDRIRYFDNLQME